MQYKISFIDNKDNEFMGTTEHFTTDGRYNLDTVLQVAIEAWRHSFKHNDITGYNIRKNSFNSAVIRTVKF